MRNPEEIDLDEDLFKKEKQRKESEDSAYKINRKIKK